MPRRVSPIRNTARGETAHAGPIAATVAPLVALPLVVVDLQHELRHGCWCIPLTVATAAVCAVSSVALPLGQDFDPGMDSCAVTRETRPLWASVWPLRWRKQSRESAAATRLRGLARGHQARVSRRRQGQGAKALQASWRRAAARAGGRAARRSQPAPAMRPWCPAGSQVPQRFGGGDGRSGAGAGFGGEAPSRRTQQGRPA